MKTSFEIEDAVIDAFLGRIVTVLEKTVANEKRLKSHEASLVAAQVRQAEAETLRYNLETERQRFEFERTKEKLKGGSN